MSVSTLQLTAPINVQRSSIDSEGKEAGFLTFNYLNKHARVRVSPQSIDLSGVPGKANFLVVSNSRGWFAAITRSTTNDLELSCSPLSHLQQAFASNPPAGVEEISFEPQRTITISGTPNLLSLACNDTRLLIAFTHGPISVYDCSQLFTHGASELLPIHTFPGTLPSQQMEPNPGDMPDLVAVLREGDNPPVQVLNVQTFQPFCGWNTGGTPESTPCAREFIS
ncbi:hypothetical protein BDM02DRAFT_1489932 [Thelephora ganbajun]|uniref:Uncharacterized protein n=1 Tax=Thelephora ganbajun TaxID=370292 RepID=A0ACB6ZKK1_THEGA|nr:hypothetical protein BDM02DRAFT_1489932 [Thelephora ganbajun]